MNTKYTIKNFRVFDEKGVTVDIKPITILTGCNSSGKSSIVKSMVLLNTYIDKLLEDFKAFDKVNLKKHKLDFTKDITISLGNFDRVRHSGSEDKTITFQYQVHSLLMGEDVKVSLVFVSDDNDELKEGYLKEITILNLADDIIYTSSKEKPCSANYNLIVNNFFRFSFGQLLVALLDVYLNRKKYLYGLQTEDEFRESLKGMSASLRTQEEEAEKNLKVFQSAIESYRNSFVSHYGEDSLHDIEAWMFKKGDSSTIRIGGYEKKQKPQTLVEKWCEGNTEALDASLKFGTLFYFPLLEKLYSVDADSFKNTLLSLFQDVVLEQEVLLAIDKISDDFVASKEKSFGDYFKMKEHKLLTLESQAFKREAPYIGGTRFLRTDDNSFEGYLNWSRRILGPEFTEFEGNILSLRGFGEEAEWKNCPESFALIYDIMMNLNYLLDSADSIFYTKNEPLTSEKYFEFSHKVFNMFKEYTSDLLEETVVTAIPHRLSYVATSLVNVKRDYSFDSNDSFSSLVKRYFNAQRAYKNSRENGVLGKESFVSKWVRRLGLGYSVSMDVSNSGSSFIIRLYKTEDDTIGTILAEEGYGVTQIVTLLIRIETAILESEKKVDVDDHECPFCTFSESTIAIEEPEVHLHPLLQSKLAEMFVDAYKNYNVHFIIETHSEYLIRKLQTLIAKKEALPNDVAILYVYDADISKRPLYTPQVKMIELEPDGRLSDSFGEGFFDEADRLSMSLLDIKVNSDEKK